MRHCLLRHPRRILRHELTVEEKKSLRSHRGGGTYPQGSLGIGVVEDFKERIEHGPLHEGIHAATALLFGRGPLPVATRLGPSGNHFPGKGGEEPAPAPLRIEGAGALEN